MEARHQQGPTVVMITATPVIPRPHMGARFELIGYRNYYQEIQRYVNQHGFNLQVESVSELPTTTGKIKKSEQAAWESKDVVVLTTPDHVRPQKQPLSYEHEEGTGQYRLSLDGLDCTKALYWRCCCLSAALKRE
ncbi:MAG: hypothetical protein U0003_00530 [Vampirovibrionales bacterium]